jgi:hypothetical protein
MMLSGVGTTKNTHYALPVSQLVTEASNKLPYLVAKSDFMNPVLQYLLATFLSSKHVFFLNSRKMEFQPKTGFQKPCF